MKNILIENPDTIKAVESFPIHWWPTNNRKEYNELYSNTIAEEMIKSLICMINYTSGELDSYFTLEEAQCLYEILFSSHYNVLIEPKEYILCTLEDKFEYECVSELLTRKRKAVLKKIKDLSKFQAYTILLMYSLVIDDPSGFDTLNKCSFVKK